MIQRTPRHALRHTIAPLLLALSLGCQPDGESSPPQAASPANTDPGRASELVESGGLWVPAGFTAELFADDVGRARHLGVRDNGDVFVRLREPQNGGGVAALRDEDGDGRADRVETFGPGAGTGLLLHDGWLWFSSRTEVWKVRLPEGDDLIPVEDPVLVVSGFPEQRSHTAKALAFDDDGSLYVNSGAPSNACQEEARTAGSPGLDPCPQLERGGGVWRFDVSDVGADRAALDQSDGERFATGIRNAVGLGWSEELGRVVAASHGRDQLDSLWGEHFTTEQNAELPAEELLALEENGDYGWPYAYWDADREARILSPEYGGDGEMEAEAGRFLPPAVALPAHWAPNAIVFYDGVATDASGAFPEEYRGGAFVALHGSWNRAPLPQGGYNVVFVPLRGGELVDDWRVFADGFSGARARQEPLMNPRDADSRPTGLALGPDGSLYVSDSVAGKIWRIRADG